jgi:CheY-like chemotaxis protein
VWFRFTGISKVGGSVPKAGFRPLGLTPPSRFSFQGLNDNRIEASAELRLGCRASGVINSDSPYILSAIFGTGRWRLGNPMVGSTTPSSQSGEATQQEKDLAYDANRSFILIVDDDTELLGLVSRMVELLGYHATVAEDAVDALYYLSKTLYDLVLADYDMPSMNGYQLAQKIKRDHSATKVIVMTAHRQKELIDSLKASDAIDGLLLKPFDLNTLGQTIELVL